MYIPNDERYIEISNLEAYKNYFQSQINNLINRMNVIERDNDILNTKIISIKNNLNSLSLWEFIKAKIKKRNIC